MVGHSHYYGSGSVVSAQLASRAWTITATAERAGLNPLAYLTAYLTACAHAGGTAPQCEALTRFLPWAASTHDLTTWAHDPRPRPSPDTTATSTPATADSHTGPAP